MKNCKNTVIQPNIACILMASGLGRRFGGNKLLAEYCGLPLIRHALHASDGLFDTRIVVTRHPQVAEICTDAGVEVFLHDLPYRSDTVRLGINAALDSSPEITGCIFQLGDQPLLKKESIELLLSRIAEAPERIWRLTASGSGKPGNPVYFPRSLFAELTSLPEDAGGSYVIKRHPELVSAVPITDEAELIDIDTPEQLEQINTNRTALVRPAKNTAE